MLKMLQSARDAWERATAGVRPGTQGVDSFADLLAYEALVADGVVLLKHAFGQYEEGGLLAGFWYVGPDLESASGDALSALSDAVNRAMKRLDVGWMVHVEAFRVARYSPFPGAFRESVDRLIDEERGRGAFYYVTQCAIFVTHTPGILAGSKGEKVRRLFLGQTGDEQLAGLEGRIEAFEVKLAEFEESMGAAVEMVRMRSRADNDELLQALNLAVNGQWLPAVRAPREPAALAQLLARDLVWAPDRMVHGDDLVDVIGVLDLPRNSVPRLLSALTTVASEIRWSSRFLLEDYGGAKDKLGSLNSKWSQKRQSLMSHAGMGQGEINLHADERLKEVQSALADIENGVVRYGHYTTVVVLRASSKEELAQKRTLVKSVLDGHGFVSVVESFNRLEALLGSLPGHGVQNVRKPMLHSLNFADMIPLEREWEGSPRCPSPMYPAGSEALMKVRSWSGSPFYLNLFQGDLGHTLVLGPSGAGKSVLLAQLATQFGRYPTGQVFVLDQGASMAPLALARRDGAFYALGADQGVRLCPLAEIDTETDRAWAADWLETLCEAQRQPLTVEQRARLFEAVCELAEVTASAPERAKKRTLTHLVAHLSDQATVVAALAYYTSGPAATVLNGDSDAMTCARFTMFELEKLLELDAKVVKPTLMFLFRQIEKRLDGRPTLLVVDEAWRQLADPAFAGRLAAWLKTFRRKNCAVVLATQQLSDVASSAIGHVVFEACATRILLPNDAATAAMRALYADCLHLSDEQMGLLASVERKRWYLYVASGRSRLFTLDVGPVAAAFCGASSAAELARVWALAREHGPRWPIAWLRERGLVSAADRFVELEVQRMERTSKGVD
jgi:type IV secretion system protein TrbE